MPQVDLSIVTFENRAEGRAPPCEIRYKISPTYVKAPMLTTKPSSIPFTSDMKNSSKTNPLITVTRAVTVHTTLYKYEQSKRNK